MLLHPRCTLAKEIHTFRMAFLRCNNRCVTSFPIGEVLLIASGVKQAFFEYPARINLDSNSDLAAQCISNQIKDFDYRSVDVHSTKEHCEVQGIRVFLAYLSVISVLFLVQNIQKNSHPLSLAQQI
jgi:hypothetical protein